MPEEIDFRQVARIHMQSIDQGFLPTLGEGFLALMYQAIHEAENAVLIVETDEDRISGFAAGAAGMGTVYKQMLRHFPRLVMQLAPAIIQPQKVWRIIEILRHSSGDTDLGNLPPQELLSIAVIPAKRGKGVAERLYNQLATHFTHCGSQGFRIVVGKELAPAHRFYTRMGAIPIQQISVHGGSPSTVYLQQL